MSDLERLLDLQDHDTVIDQLHHRRSHLPEHGELAEVAGQLTAVEAALTEARSVLGGVTDRQSALEAEVATAEARIAEIDKRLYGGTVSASRDLQAMSSEVDHLKQRRASLEDDVLAAMEEADPLTGEVARIDEARRELSERRDALQTAIDDAQRAIDTELATATSERSAIAAEVSEPLKATYERIRARLGGIGAARLVGTSCSGCHLTLPATEVARIRVAPPDEMVFCDQCGRILVR
jgi:predicted  nucleic acid-binding Zn-ribbon protein